MYKLVATESLIIRTFFLTNPFEQLPEPLMMPLGTESILISPVVLNWLCSGVIAPFTYAIVSMYYHPHFDDPAKGSLLYLFFFWAHTGLIALMARASFATWAIVGISILYVAAHILFRFVFRRFDNYGRVL